MRLTKPLLVASPIAAYQFQAYRLFWGRYCKAQAPQRDFSSIGNPAQFSGWCHAWNLALTKPTDDGGVARLHIAAHTEMKHSCITFLYYLTQSKMLIKALSALGCPGSKS